MLKNETMVRYSSQMGFVFIQIGPKIVKNRMKPLVRKPQAGASPDRGEGIR
jgi:hypothetical protein